MPELQNQAFNDTSLRQILGILGLAAPLHNSSFSSAFPAGNGLPRSEAILLRLAESKFKNLPALGINQKPC